MLLFSVYFFLAGVYIATTVSNGRYASYVRYSSYVTYVTFTHFAEAFEKSYWIMCNVNVLNTLLAP